MSTMCGARQRHGDSLTAVMIRPAVLKPLVREVAGTVREMPLWKLQTVGAERQVGIRADGSGGGFTWLRADQMVTILRNWRALFLNSA